MPRRKRDEGGSNIASPWDAAQDVVPKIQCPNCENDGMDGSITAKTNQWGLQRICLRCNHKWTGSIGVQRADFSNPPTLPGVDTAIDDRPSTQFTGAPHRDPRKNVDGDD